jgi:methylenetetrahydrofolate dehydrogenase (NADP+)/methenyltetrahydrofolate cyclohydrolase
MENSCKIIKGADYASNLYKQLELKLAELAKYKIVPGLAVILVGNNPASHVYVRNKISQAERLGIKVFSFQLPEETSLRILLNKIDSLNNDIRIHGILVQLPLPHTLNSDEVINAINPEKDVDGFHPINAGKLLLGQDCLIPCTPQGIILMLREIFPSSQLAGKKAVVVGRSRIVGAPLAIMLSQANCTVTVVHSQTLNPEREAYTADILVSAVGKPGLITTDWVKPGACVIDVGITRINDKLYGDVDFASVLKVAGILTPVPGGVGPMTVACMLANTIKATYHQKKIEYTNVEIY